MSLTLADIDRWDPSAIRSVSEALGKRGASAAEVRAGLSKLPLIASWQGSGGDAARAALDKLSRFLAEHAEQMAAVSRATSAGADKVKAVKDALAELDDIAARERFSIDHVTGEVTPLDTSRFNDPLYAMEQMNLEAGVQKVLADAAAVDAELARALTDGTNQPPIPVALPPPGGGPPMSEGQIKDTIDDMLAGQDLSPAEAQRLSDILRTNLQASVANGLNADNAYANAENAAVSYMDSLHRSYVRKPTRLGIFDGAERTRSGDFRSSVSGLVIPAARNADGSLIWVDKVTGAHLTADQIRAGTEGAMTIPERGYYHLGHEFGQENWRVLQQAREEGWTQAELNDFMNKNGQYRLETPAENSGHAHEDHSPYVRNPEWTPQRVLEGASAGVGAAGGTAPIIAPPPNLPNALNHPPVALPPPNMPPVQGPPLPQLAPTPALPPWLTDPGYGHGPNQNPLTGPYGVTMDTPNVPVSPPPSGFHMPDLSINIPDITPNVTPQDAAETGGFVAGIGAVATAGGWVLGQLAHPFG
jgi:hypothetical protein